MIEIKTPELGESIESGTIGKIYKKAGEFVKKDELILEIETEKVVLEIVAPNDGVIAEFSVKQDDVIKKNDIICKLDPKAKSEGSSSEKPVENKEVAGKSPAPSAQKIISENNLDSKNIQGSGKDGQILKNDAMNAINKGNIAEQPSIFNGEKEIKRVKMSKLRQTIAKRLKDSQNTAAILTTFNEVDMHNVMELRSKYKDVFEKKHGAKLGFMSFFVKAAVQALYELPAVNAEIDGDEIVYKNYYDIGVAVGTENGLVVPVVQNCDKLSMSDIEKKIVEYGKKARDGKLSIAEMQGGTFTISNGGVYGSLLSTPIINPPQSGILGLHNIVKRPVVIDDQIVIRPMMYIALSYDHRIVDGKEAVTFLVRIKEFMENPARLLMEV